MLENGMFNTSQQILRTASQKLQLAVTMSKKSVDDYITGLDDWKGEIVSEIRSIIRDSAPEAKESIKWAQPVYEINGPFCYIKAFKKSVNFGFWRGIDINDPSGLLQGTGEKMRHVKLTSLSNVNESVFSGFVKQAVGLNLVKGDPTKGA
jgi:hypothetical protein